MVNPVVEPIRTKGMLKNRYSIRESLPTASVWFCLCVALSAQAGTIRVPPPTGTEAVNNPAPVTPLDVKQSGSNSPTLEIGGFDLRLGESFEDTVQKLSAMYELENSWAWQSHSTSTIWWIRRRDPDRTIVGELHEDKGRVISLARYWSGDSLQLLRSFALYLEEAKRLGGSLCATAPDWLVAAGELHLRGYTTKCGRYRVEHGLATRPGKQETLRLTVS